MDQFTKALNKASKVQSLGSQLKGYGYNVDDIRNMSDISRADVAGAERTQQYNLLNELLGSQERIAEDTSEGYLSNDILRDILAKYSK